MATTSMATTKSVKESSQKPKRQQELSVDPFTKWMKRAVLLLVLVATCGWLDTIKHRWYVFDPTELHELAKAAIAAHPDDMPNIIDYIVTNLTQTYPTSERRVALNTNSKEWVLNNAGGAMGAMYVIHASITEYLIIFGTPLGTEGHTGLHTADDYFNVLVGEQWAFSPGALEMERYPPGSVHYLPRGTAKQYKMHEGCFAMEYARGWIPLMMPFGLADILSSTLDVPSFFKTVKISLREMTKNILIGKI